MGGTHARLSPSGAHRWLRCPGSVQAIEEIGERPASEFAAHGTVAHEVRDMCLSEGFEPEDFLGQVWEADGFAFEIDHEMVQALTPGIERIREQGGDQWFERRVSFDPWLPDQFGTLDVGLVLGDLIEINDLKYGEGVAVSPVENEQLMIYALGFWSMVSDRLETPPKTFRLVIDQPRQDAGGGEWEVATEDLLKFAERLYPAYLQAIQENAPKHAGDKQCRFCDAKSFCGELARWSAEVMDAKFDDLEEPDFEAPAPENLTAAQRSIVVQRTPLIRKWLNKVHEHVMADAMDRRDTPGLKPVLGKRGDATWKDEEAAKAFLVERGLPEEDMHAIKLISPTQAGKALGKAVAEEIEETMISRSPGKPVLVEERDERPAIVIDDKFDDLGDED